MFRVTQDTTKLQLASITGLSPSMAVLSRTFFSQVSCYSVVLQPHGCVATVMVWALPRSLATTGGIINLFSLPTGTKMFQFPAFALHTLWIGVWMHEVCSCGFPHSDICGSVDICSSPQLFAAYHVFLRLLVPRHPPCALFCLTSFTISIAFEMGSAF